MRLLFLKDFAIERFITKLEIPTIRNTINNVQPSDRELKIETQRYHRPKLSPDQLVCTTCEETEDEPLCIMRCKLTKGMRETTFAKILLHDIYFNNLDETAKFIFLQQPDQIYD